MIGAVTGVIISCSTSLSLAKCQQLPFIKSLVLHLALGTCVWLESEAVTRLIEAVTRLNCSVCNTCCTLYQEQCMQLPYSWTCLQLLHLRSHDSFLYSTI